MELKDFLKQEYSKKLASFMAVLLLVMVGIIVLFVDTVETSSLELVLTDSDIKAVKPGESIDYQFKLKNRGDSTQNVELSLLGVPEHWNASFDLEQERIEVRPQSYEIFYLSVSAPDNGEAPTYAPITVEARGGNNVSLKTTVTYLIPKLEYKASGGSYKEYPDGLKLENGMSFKTNSTGMWSLGFEKVAAMSLHKNSEITINEMTYNPLLSQRMLKLELHNKFLYNGKVTFQTKLPTADSFLDVSFRLGAEQKRYSVRVDHTEETIFSLTLSGENYKIKVFKGSVKLLDYNSRSRAIGEDTKVTTVDEGTMYDETETSAPHSYNLIKITSPADVALFKEDSFVGAGSGGNFTHELPNVAYLDIDDGEGATSDNKYFIIEDDGTGLSGEYRFELSGAAPVETAVVEILRYDASKYGGEAVVITIKFTPEESASFSISVDNGKNQVKISSSIPSEYTIKIDVGNKTVFETSNIRISNDKHEQQMHSLF